MSMRIAKIEQLSTVNISTSGSGINLIIVSLDCPHSKTDRHRKGSTLTTTVNICGRDLEKNLNPCPTHTGFNLSHPELPLAKLFIFSTQDLSRPLVLFSSYTPHSRLLLNFYIVVSSSPPLLPMFSSSTLLLFFSSTLHRSTVPSCAQQQQPQRQEPPRLTDSHLLAPH